MGLDSAASPFSDAEATSPRTATFPARNLRAEEPLLPEAPLPGYPRRSIVTGVEVNHEVLARGASGFVDVSVVIHCSTTWLYPEQWGTHEWDDVDATLPADAKPLRVVHAPLDATLESVLQRAARDFGLAPPPDSPERARAPISPRIGFVSPGDDHGHDDRTNLDWPTEIPVAQPDGTVVLRTAHQLTYRELVVASALGLVEGDVLSPYLIPRQPQGFAPIEPEAIRLAAEAVRAAYDSLPAATHEAARLLEEFRALVLPRERDVLDEVGRDLLLWQGFRAVRRKLRQWRKKPDAQ